MDIIYLGHSSFQLKGASAKVVTDPFDTVKVGLPFPKVEADIITISHDHDDHNQSKVVSGTPTVFDIPGEYEKMGVRVTGFPTYHDKSKGEERGQNTVFLIEIDDISILHCGDLGHVLDDALVSEIGSVDILMVPCGGVYTLTPEDAVKVTRSIEPSIVIPMHYRVAGLTLSRAEEMQPVDAFLAQLGNPNVEEQSTVKIKKSDFTDESSLRVIVMKK